MLSRGVERKHFVFYNLDLFERKHIQNLLIEGIFLNYLGIHWLGYCIQLSQMLKNMNMKLSDSSLDDGKI